MNLKIGSTVQSKLLGSTHKVTGIIKKNGKYYLYTDLQQAYSYLEDFELINK